MKQVKFSNIIESDLKDTDYLIKSFKKYAIKELEYDEFGAEIAASDMQDPYNTPYIKQDYYGDVEICGKKYEVRLCSTNFMMCGLFELADKAPFEFYMLIDIDSLEDRTVGSYTKANKKYICNY